MFENSNKEPSSTIQSTEVIDQQIKDVKAYFRELEIIREGKEMSHSVSNFTYK
jgi:hypothetical protein